MTPAKVERPLDPQLAVLIRVKNEISALPEFWRRLSSQTILSRTEVIFLDSGSTDGTLDFLLGLPVCVYEISPSDFQFGRSCNQLISVSQAQILVLLSGHVLLEQHDALERLFEKLVEHEHAAAYMRQVPNTLWGASAYEKAFLAKRFAPEKSKAIELHEPLGFSNSASGLTRAAWQRNPFPEIGASEDFIWAKRHLSLGGKLFYLPSVTVMHSHRESPDAVFQRVRLNVRARKKTGSYLEASYYFSGILLSLILKGTAFREAWQYAEAHARAYLPQGS
ncbi:glycosyltransferase involved in cell wall biosynthesis [Granulicella aggregans]|uniref:Glycosyltransferase involved in cell wall biosynthesis n=1 Tax=Granulicella aggregans TaxID=474949 RepID=A0A7W7ZCA3_9BACT|nr:glycosyltransferase [Granulicella aggregans]MBB5057280.1 glycosyltransferase involved in cell wall biosynthesis [Granulicella aggregans]